MTTDVDTTGYFTGTSSPSRSAWCKFKLSRRRRSALFCVDQINRVNCRGMALDNIDNAIKNTLSGYWRPRWLTVYGQSRYHKRQLITIITTSIAYRCPKTSKHRDGKSVTIARGVPSAAD